MSYRSAPSQHRGAVCKTCEAVTHHIITKRHMEDAHFERIVRNANLPTWEDITKYAEALVCLKCATATPH